MTDRNAVDAVSRTLAASARVAVLTGAGVSAESGVPTFRDAQQGLWARFDPMDLATPDAFARDPQTAWDWYRWRRKLVADVAPNPAHEALARLAGLVPALTLVTQNVDGLHQRAGSDGVIEFHGDLFSDKCSPCGVRVPATDTGDGDPPPRCERCGTVMTPGVVLFGEAIPAAAMAGAERAATACDVFLVVGTSSQVYPAAGLAGLAAGHGATVVEINPETTALSDAADHVLRGPAGEVIPALVEALTRQAEVTP